MLKKERVCKDCYIQNVGHRFKNTLLRYCRVQKDFPNLVAVSGGSNSMAMLNLIWMCLSGNKSQKKMFFKVHVLYIDETSIFGVNQEEADRRRRVITDACD
jgi:3'-phosphoadenosine 5'-phosphosulfate sulfotransferase (PAPS reductase)/FAD synthetase